jgi:L-ascorbate metabolism protein UlaG (beta-lactamase superfamily)
MARENKISDHHNGRHFFNPTHPADHGFKDVLKFLLTSRNQPWPKWIDNHPQLNLEAALARNEAAVTFVNHATVLIQFQGFNILTDPVWSMRASPLQWLGPKRVRAPGIPFDELPRIDLVLISHNHYDHLDVATLKKLRTKFNPHFVVAKGDLALMNKHGLHAVTELDWWENFYFRDGLSVTMAPTQHFSSRTPFDRNRSIWGSYQIRFPEGQQIYFGGDAAYSIHFKEIKKRLGAPDLALIPIGAYEPRWFMKQIHMDAAEAVEAHLDLGAKQSVGIHFGTFQLTEEKIDQPVIDLRAALQAKRISENNFVILGEGQTKIYRLENRMKSEA